MRTSSGASGNRKRNWPELARNRCSDIKPTSFMNPILDQYIPTGNAFRPKTMADLLALRLARKLNDAEAVRHYAELASQYSEAELLSAFRRTVNSGAHSDPGR